MTPMLPPDMRPAFEAALERLPEHLREGLHAYVCHGRPCGHFLRAVIEGELFTAVRRADDVSRGAIGDLVDVLIEYAPGRCCGSHNAYDVWVADGAQLRRRERERAS